METAKIDPMSEQAEKILNDVLDPAITIMPDSTDPVEAQDQMQHQEKGVEWLNMRKAQLLDSWSKQVQDFIYEKSSNSALNIFTPEQDESLRLIFATTASKMFKDFGVIKNIAHEFADLENDFNYVKDINTGIAQRYDEVFQCLPSLTEIDALIDLTSNKFESDDAFFCTAPKTERLEKLKKLRGAIAKQQGS